MPSGTNWDRKRKRHTSGSQGWIPDPIAAAPPAPKPWTPPERYVPNVGDDVEVGGGLGPGTVDTITGDGVLVELRSGGIVLAKWGERFGARSSSRRTDRR